MATQYLLPCSCGKTVTVEQTQAGQWVRCKCGAKHEVPTLRGLRQLKQVKTATAQEPSWNVSQGVVLLSLIIAVLSFGMGIYLIINAPPHPRDVADKILSNAKENFDQSVNTMTLKESLIFWEGYKSRGLKFGPTGHPDVHQAKEHYYRFFLVPVSVAFGLGIIGLFVAACVRFTLRENKSNRKGTSKSSAHQK